MTSNGKSPILSILRVFSCLVSNIKLHIHYEHLFIPLNKSKDPGPSPAVAVPFTSGEV